MRCWRSVVCGVALVTGVVLFAALIYSLLGQGSCEEGSFPCGNSSVCVPQHSICDGRPDCPGGDDESVKYCVDFHGYSYLSELVQNATDFDRNGYEICDLGVYPEACTCQQHSYLYCTNKGLTHIPQPVSLNVTRMILVNNTIKDLPVDSFVNYSLNIIHLEGNRINYLPPGIFDGQKQLERLFLTNNRISSLEKGIFTGLRSLLWLFLDVNLLHTVHLADFEDLRNLVWLDMSYNKLTLESSSFPRLPKLQFLILHDNLIEKIGEDLLAKLTTVTQLNLQRNLIRSIHSSAFRYQKRLDKLDLSHNYIKTLPSSVFNYQFSLSRLSLGANPFHFISKQLFKPLGHLQSLELQEIEIQNIDIEMFSIFKNLEFVYFKSFYYCTYAPKVPKCKPNTDGVSSMEHLLARPVLRVTVWVIAGTTALGNGLVLWGRLTSREESSVQSLVIRNLAVSDLLMGVYLLVIGYQDLQFRDIYRTVAQSWMSSWSCTLSGILAMTSSEVSVLILVFMSLERFLLIAVPFGGQQALTVRNASMYLLVIWITGLALAVIPVIHWRQATRFYGTSGMCFPLHIEDPFLIGWQYTAFILFGINFTGMILMAVLYSGMFVSIWRTRKATPIASIRDLEYLFRFFFIVLTDAGCWAPIIILRVMSMLHVHIPADLYAWVVVLILPVNSAVNPLLYTFTTPRYRGQLRQMSLALGVHRPLVNGWNGSGSCDPVKAFPVSQLCSEQSPGSLSSNKKINSFFVALTHNKGPNLLFNSPFHDKSNWQKKKKTRRFCVPFSRGRYVS